MCKKLKISANASPRLMKLYRVTQALQYLGEMRRIKKTAHDESYATKQRKKTKGEKSS
jgi:hypothetical protein